MRVDLRVALLLSLSLLAGCASAGTEVSFTNGDITLAGTLLLPESDPPFPAVVLIHGSGEVERSELEYFAKIFVRNGYAALVYDKRGVGESTGDPNAWRRFRFEDLAADALAGVDFLSARSDIDASRIGLFGASQGGWVAPLAAAESEQVAFLIAFSASVCTVAEDRLFERAARLRSEGFTEDEIQEVSAMQLVDQAVTRSGTQFEEFTDLWQRNHDKRWFRRVYLGEEPVAPDHEWRLWYRTILDFDSRPLLEKLSIPMLWLFGDPLQDRFGPVQLSVDRLNQLREAGKEYTIEVFPGTDHNLQYVDGGGEAPFSRVIAEWLRGLDARLASGSTGD